MSHMKLNFGYGDLLLNIPANLEILVGGALLKPLNGVMIC